MPVAVGRRRPNAGNSARRMIPTTIWRTGYRVGL